tara:strand:+ start:3394 stop:5277 length:1884 start_codon:yes stop_codon:yes gene_type:complete
MLQDIREKSLGTFGKVIVGIIIAVFALFGVESIIGGFTQPPAVANVNGEDITQFQLDQNIQNLMASIGGNLDGIDPSFLESIALNQLIEETLLRQKTLSDSMSISSDQIDRNIVSTESFQINGIFDSELAVRTMATQGLTVPMYRDSLEQRMMMSQLANAFTNSNFVTEEEFESFTKLSTQTRDFRYISLTMGTRTLGVPIADDEISTYYENNKGQFTEEESVIVEYVLLDKTSITEELNVDENDLLEQYASEKEEFEGSSEKRASHILFEISSDVPQEVAIELAENTKARIDAGEDFSELALEVSIDTVSAEEGGDIGFTDGTAFPPEVEETLNRLALNEVSSPVVSEFGVHLVKLTQDANNSFPSFEETRDRLERELTASEVESIYSERLQDLSNLAFETGDLRTIEEVLSLEVEESDPIPRSGGSGLFANPEIVSAAYSDEVLIDRNNSDVIELSDSQSLVLRVSEFREAFVLPLADVDAEIAVILRTEMERQAVQDLGQELFDALQAGLSIDELLAQNELEWINEVGVDRNSFTVNREIVSEAFKLQDPGEGLLRTNLTLTNDTFVVIELNQVNEGSADSIPAEQSDNMLDSLRADMGNNDFQAYMTSLREDSDIQTNLEQAF